MLRSVAVVSLLTAATQAVHFVTQLVIAHLFGVQADMDAYLAAITLPQFTITVVLTSLGFVFIPVFVHHASEGRDDEAWTVASGVINLSLVTLLIITAGGMLFAEKLLRWSAPGLAAETLELATQVAMVSWPSVVVTSLTTLLVGIYHAQERFGRPAGAPFIGALVNLGVVLALAGLLGVVGIAIATIGGLLVQAVLLSPAGLRKGRYRFGFHLHHPGVRRVLRLLWPLALSGVFIKATPLVERYLASEMEEGSISLLGYAFRLEVVLSTLVATGIAIVIFPRMAQQAAQANTAGLREIVSKGLRYMWLATAPLISVGWVLALPVVTVLLRHGEFTAEAAVGVAALLQVYLLGLSGACLGNVSGRAYYALGHTRVLAIIGAGEALAYIVYTAILADYLGALGVALGYAIYMNASFLWQIIVLRGRLGGRGGRTLVCSFLRISFCAVVGAGAAWLGTHISDRALVQMLVGGALGLGTYFGVLLLLRSKEAVDLTRLILRRTAE